MDEIAEAVQTVSKMSPPMLIVVVAGILCVMLKPFMPENYLMPVATVGGAAVAPWLFSHGTLAYDVPSPGTALVLVGAIMGFLGSVFHRRIDRWVSAKRRNGSGDTRYLSRAEAGRGDTAATHSGAPREPHEPPEAPQSERRMGS